MRCIPNVVLMAPRDASEFRRMFALAVDQSTRPVAIRYPKAGVPTNLPLASDDLEIGRGEILIEGQDVAIFAYGSMVDFAYQAAQNLLERGIDVTVVDARFAKPLDVDLLRDLSERHQTLLTVEEHVLNGGFGSAVVEACADESIAFQRIKRLGVPDRFMTFGGRDHLLRECGLDGEGIEDAVEGVLAPPGSPQSSSRLAAGDSLVRSWKGGFTRR